jgi:hypothetical protein
MDSIVSPEVLIHADPYDAPLFSGFIFNVFRKSIIPIYMQNYVLGVTSL